MARRIAQKDKEESKKKKCLKCLVEKEPTKNFYKSFSEWHGDGLLPICKGCLKERLQDKEENLSLVREIVRVLDKPYKRNVWLQALESKKDTLGEYFRLINLNNKTENYDHSVFDNNTEVSSSNWTEEETESDFEADEETMRYWGKGYLNWEYEFLEKERIKLMSSFECPDYGMEMIMKDICFINLDIEKIRFEKKSNSHTEITKLIKTRSELMNSANMNPIQSTGAEGNDQITFGTLIKKWENEKPVPRQLEDEMKHYIDTFMVGHLAKMEGLHNELTDKYDKALSEYTINFNEIHNNDDEFDE